MKRLATDPYVRSYARDLPRSSSLTRLAVQRTTLRPPRDLLELTVLIYATAVAVASWSSVAFALWKAFR